MSAVEQQEEALKNLQETDRELFDEYMIKRRLLWRHQVLEVMPDIMFRQAMLQKNSKGRRKSLKRQDGIPSQKNSNRCLNMYPETITGKKLNSYRIQ